MYKTPIFILLISLILDGGPVYAQTFPQNRGGRIAKIWADPSDVVFELTTAGPCGSTLYHVERSATNFQEMYALLLTAAASGRHVEMQLSGCKWTDRNIVSQGHAVF
jgi:hypothetical protein